MYPKLDHLHVLDTVARRGSLSAAGEVLGMATSGVSYAINKLEEQLGVELLDRTEYRVKLTPAGREVLKVGRIVLRQAHTIQHVAQAAQTGWESELGIAVSDLLYADVIVGLVSDFYAEDAPTRLRIGKESFDGTWQALAEGKVDLVIGGAGEPTVGEDIQTILLGYRTGHLTMSPNHPLAEEPEPVPVDVAATHRSVIVGGRAHQELPRLITVLPGQEFYSVPDLQIKLALLKRGLGIGFMPDNLIADAIDRGEVVTRELVGGTRQVPIYLGWRHATSGRALNWCIEWVTSEKVREKLQLDAQV
ncbi:MAG TPA: LysR family transcriptional regulator [Gammaproteobacteria bacterium]|nr:LysR family transcriptional regulator [Gammaproteobacteria bacterium]